MPGLLPLIARRAPERPLPRRRPRRGRGVSAALGRSPRSRSSPRPPGRPRRGLARDGVRLLVATPDRLQHAHFSDLPRLLDPGDLLVVNTSATLPASLRATRSAAPRSACNLSTPVPFEDGDSWIVELRRDGERMRDGVRGRAPGAPGRRARPSCWRPTSGRRLWIAALSPARAAAGLPRSPRRADPLRPPRLAPGRSPPTRPSSPPSRAAPRCRAPGRPSPTSSSRGWCRPGIDVAPIVLHTGVSSLESGEAPYAERFRVPESTATRVNAARRRGGRVIAVGTTAVRALESAADRTAAPSRPAGGWTELVIGPERPVRSIDGLLTGFHDSDSSHLWMLAAVAGPDLIDRSQRAAAAGRLPTPRVRRPAAAAALAPTGRARAAASPARAGARPAAATPRRGTERDAGARRRPPARRRPGGPPAAPCRAAACR